MAVARLSGNSLASTGSSNTSNPGGTWPTDTFRVAVLFVATTNAVTLPNANWTAQVDTTSNLGATGRLVVASRFHSGADSAQVFSWGTSVAYALRVNAYTGVDTLNPWDVAPDEANILNNTTGTSLTGAAITPTLAAYGIWVWMQARTSGASTATISTPGAIDVADAIVRPTGASGQILQWGADTVMTAGVDSGTMTGTANASGPWRTIPFALREIQPLGPEPGRRLLLAA